MSRFFINKSDIVNNEITLTDDNHKHLSFVLRARQGDTVTVCDGECVDYLCKVNCFTKDATTLTIINSSKNKNESDVKYILFQALPKGDKAEYIIEKAVELGAYRICFFESINCISKLNSDKAQKKSERFNSISLTAAKQCNRGIIPKVDFCGGFDNAFNNLLKYKNHTLFYEGGNTVYIKEIFSSMNDIDEYAFMIGPEGGFDIREIEKAKEHNIVLGSLGNRILRTETASLFVLSSLEFYYN